MEWLILIPLAYLLGSLPFGYWIARLWFGGDIRHSGSGNIGMTNVMRVAGKAPGILTFLLDFAKGTAAVALAMYGPWFCCVPLLEKYGVLLIGGVAIFGHTCSIFLRFDGGKGISTTFGVMAMANITVALAAALVWAGVFGAKKISSLSALCMLAALPLIVMVENWINAPVIDWWEVLAYSLLALLLIYKHKGNIKRLLQGQESQLKAHKR